MACHGKRALTRAMERFAAIFFSNEAQEHVRKDKQSSTAQNINMGLRSAAFKLYQCSVSLKKGQIDIWLNFIKF